MKLIVGLGNPGNEYNFTRHNYGFLALDFYATVKHLTWQKPKFGALWLKDGDHIFIKPQDFYNNSGVAVAAFVRFYKLELSDLLVVCDDFDLDFGQIRYRAHGSSAGNNGLNSINQHLKSDNFARLRLGTNNPTVRQQLGDIDFVLGHFTKAEQDQLPDLLTSIIGKIDQSLI